MADLFDLQDFTEVSQLLHESKLYRYSYQYYELLQFIIRLRDFAPFNALLLEIQKPNLMYAATAEDWDKRFHRQIKDNARPLVILWPFSPVRFVYDVEDTIGTDLPSNLLNPFRSTGWMYINYFENLVKVLANKNILLSNNLSNGHIAGQIYKYSKGIIQKDENKKPIEQYTYEIKLNPTHDLNVQFSTLVHELGHLFLGHLGSDTELKIQERYNLSSQQLEIEAETLSYLVCKRLGIVPNSEEYIAGFLSQNLKLPPLDIYLIAKAAGRVESLVKLPEFSSILKEVRL